MEHDLHALSLCHCTELAVFLIDSVKIFMIDYGNLRAGG
jgi:hypothetical protein